MKCERCNKEFDTTKPELNVETYGGHAVFACPHCHKPYLFSRRIIIDVSVFENCNREFDDWGRKIRK